MKIRNVVAVLFLSTLGFALAGCDTEGPAERTGEEVDRTMENAGERLEQQREQAGEQTER